VKCYRKHAVDAMDFDNDGGVVGVLELIVPFLFIELCLLSVIIELNKVLLVLPKQ
jgi:hypothetical protein